MRNMDNIGKLVIGLRDSGEWLMGMAIGLRDVNPGISMSSYLTAENCKKAAEELEKQGSVEAELEGGGSTWWYVCSECHTTIDSMDRFCRQCGRRIEWDGTTSGEAQD